MLLKKFKRSLKIGEGEILDVAILIIFSTLFLILVNLDMYNLSVAYSKMISSILNVKSFSNVVIYKGNAFQINKYCLGIFSYLFVTFLFILYRKINIYLVLSLIVLFLLNILRIVVSIVFSNHFYFLHDIVGNLLMILTSIFLWIFFININSYLEYERTGKIGKKSN